MTGDPDDFLDEEVAEESDGPDCCIECWDIFRYDDVGGYNPPCVCGYHCRSCHEAIEGGRDWQDDCPEDDPLPTPERDSQ